MPDPEQFQEFQEHSVAEFFKKNRQMLGYSGKIKSLTTVVHEYVTNLIDAVEEEEDNLPEAFVKIEELGPEHYKVIVEDNGPGIPEDYIGRAFGQMLAGTKFHRFMQQRGQQGIGAAGAVMFGQVTTGKPTKVITSQGDGEILECDLSIDVQENKATLDNKKTYSGEMKGTRIETEVKNVLYQKGRYGVDEYLRRTVLANPHLKLTYVDPEGKTIVYDRAVQDLPPKPKEAKPHPQGVTVDDLLGYAMQSNSQKIKSFLKNDFTRVSGKKAKEIQEKVSFDLNKRPGDLNWDEAEELVNTFDEIDFMRPPTDVLVPIGEERLKKAVEEQLEPEFKTVIERKPKAYRGGVPFVVEVALAYGGKAGNDNGEDEIEAMRFSNRVPLLFNKGSCAITKSVDSVDWDRYAVKENTPLTILVNFTSIHVPYIGAGKKAIADEEEIKKEIRLALMKAGRKLGNYLKGKRKKKQRLQKKKTFETYIPETAKSLADITGKDEEEIRKHLESVVKQRFSDIGEDED